MKKRIFIFFLILSLLLLAACSKKSDTLENLSDMELASNQALVTGQVTSRVGNDIELAVGTLSQGQGGMGAMPSGDAGSMPSGDAGSMPSGDAGSMPSGDAGSMPSDGGSRPSFDSGSMPSGGPGNGGDFSGQQPGDSSGQAAGGGTQNGNQSTTQDGTTDAAAGMTTGSQIQLTGETMSLTIPVGTKVLVTATDGTLSASSFGRIQTDDIIELILQTQDDGTQVITLMQIME